MLSYIYPVWMSELPVDLTHLDVRESPLSKPCYQTSTLSGCQYCLLISHTQRWENPRWVNHVIKHLPCLDVRTACWSHTHSELRESRLSKPCYHTSTLSGCQNCLLISQTQSWENPGWVNHVIIHLPCLDVRTACWSHTLRAERIPAE